MKAALPDYSVRRSPRAKNLRLKVTREEGLLVVVPKGYDEKKIPSVLKQKKVWITDALKRIGETRRYLEPKPVKHLPRFGWRRWVRRGPSHIAKGRIIPASASELTTEILSSAAPI
jgi:hypothetical protein